MSSALTSQEVIDWFIKHNVPSISPANSINLLKISEAVTEEIKKDPSTPKAIEAYAIALRVVANAGHIQQGVVIAQLERMIKGNKEK